MQITPQATVPFELRPDAANATAWLSALPDTLAFALGLAAARWAHWTSGDLIWSLWLSSLVVGYATIVWTICQPGGAWAMLAWRTRHDPDCSPRKMLIAWALIVVVAGFMLAFFTVHFGGFHYVQSDILLGFFPISGPGIAHPSWASKAVYAEILRRYWIFLPSAFLSHRAAFLRKPLNLEAPSVAALAGGGKQSDFFAEPYRNVMRMHALIFFFFLAHFAGLENFVVYTVIYTVYFFPAGWKFLWRALPSGTSGRA